MSISIAGNKVRSLFVLQVFLTIIWDYILSPLKRLMRKVLENTKLVEVSSHVRDIDVTNEVSVARQAVLLLR